MLSLEEELATTGADAAALAAERRDVFSLFGELRAASYLAVALVTTGVGIWLKNNADRLGPVAILTALLVASATCYAYALVWSAAAMPPLSTAAAWPPHSRRTIIAGYALLPGALPLALAALVVWRGLRGGGEAMVIYAIVYATIAFDTAVLNLVSDTALKALYLLFSTPVAIVILFVVYRRMKERRA